MSAGGGTGGYKDIPPPSPSEGDDEHTLEEQYTSDIKKEREALELLNFRQDMEARREYANKLYLLIKWWLIGIGGTHYMPRSYSRRTISSQGLFFYLLFFV